MIRQHVVALAERVSDGDSFWSVPTSQNEPVTHVHIYGHHAGHWHYVTEGLSSSLQATTKGRPAEIELSIRIPSSGESPEPAPIDLLRGIAQMMVNRLPALYDTAIFEPAILPGSTLAAIAFVLDPALGPIEDGSTRVDVYQVVGLTSGEARACVRSSTAEIVERLRTIDPYLVTHPSRAELPDLPASGPLPVSRGHTVPTLRFRLSPDGARAEIEVEPTPMRPTFIEHLVARLRNGSFFQVRGPERTIRFEQAAASAIELREEDGRPLLHIGLDAATLETFARSADPQGGQPLAIGPVQVTFVDEP